jgi:hypothetical protein
MHMQPICDLIVFDSPRGSPGGEQYAIQSISWSEIMRELLVFNSLCGFVAWQGSTTTRST